MNICITGALGHIGSYIIRNLNLNNLNNIYLVDNLLTQRYPSLFDLPADKNYIFYEMDILDERMERIIKDSDILIHLAAITDAAASFERVDDIEKVNKKGVEQVANLCAKYECKLIFPSSTSVYGSQEKLVDENCKELAPQSPYAESKIWAENLLSSLAKKKGFKHITFRFGTIFGYSIGMRFHTAVNKFIWQAVNGQKITVWKTALYQKRPYLDIQDAAAAINHTIEKDLFDSEIYNIVTHGLTVNDVVETIKKYVPNLDVELVEHKIMNQLSYDASNKKALQKGFVFRGNIDKRVRETVEKLRSVNCTVPISIKK